MKTFGQLSFKGDQWELAVEPHVAMLAKRVFAQLLKRHDSTLTMSDTLDTCRNLVWLMQRYPLKMKKADRLRLQQQANLHEDRESLVDRLTRGIEKPRKFELALPPRQYQVVAAEFVLRNKALLLGDDLGLGKTASAFCVLSDPNTRPALVIARSHLTLQWQEELKRFLPGLTTHILKKGTPYDLTLGPRKKPVPFPDVIISTSTKLAGWALTLAPLIKSLTIDEIQEFRHGTKTEKGAAAKRLAEAAEYRMGLSGTPFYNLGGELYYIMELIAPHLLGARWEFLTEWCGAEDNRGRAALRDPVAFGSYLRSTGFFLRRTRKDVGRELPQLTRVSHIIEYDKEELDKVEGPALALARKIVDRNADRLDVMRASEQLSFMLRHATGVAKAPYVSDFVKMMMEENEEPILLFAWHHDVFNIYRERLKEFPHAMFTGKESPTQKAESKRAFIAGEVKLLMMSLRAGEGTDGLQKVCRTLVFGELDWTPAVHDQDIARVYRDGQTEPVVAYFPLANDGSDPEVADGLQLKRAQIEGVRNLQSDLIERLEVDGGRIRRLAERYIEKATARRGAP